MTSNEKSNQEVAELAHSLRMPRRTLETNIVTPPAVASAGKEIFADETT